MTSPPHGPRLLVVDDSIDTRELLQRNLAAQGYEVLTAADVAEALEVLETTEVALVITDLKMPGASGLELVRFVRDARRNTSVIMVTGYPSVEGASAALGFGAEEYLPKPFTQEELFAVVGRVIAGGSRRVSRSPAEGAGSRLPGLVAASEAMRPVLETVARVAARSTPLLITGECGTGKELLARAIHYSGSRTLAPFVVFDGGGAPEELVDQQLFGYVPSHPAGAPAARAGFAGFAEGGTLFLRHVNRLPPATQAALVRALDEGRFAPAGASEAHPVRFRLMAASHRHLDALAEQGSFSRDLLARLSLDTVALPPLRERGDDVILLARHFLAEFAAELRRPAPALSPGAAEALRSYPWPGNVSELQDRLREIVQRVTGALVDAADLPDPLRTAAHGRNDLARSLADLEADHIRRVLASVAGNKTRAAEILGISRKTLRDKLKAPGDAAGR